MYRSWNPVMKRAFIGLLAGIVPNKDQFVVTDDNFHHRRACDGTAQTMKFYSENVSNSQGDGTNWPAEQGLPAEEGFWMTGFCISVESNNSVAGDEVASTDMIREHATAAAVATYAGQLLAFLQTGRITLRIGGRDIIKDVYGINKYPCPWDAPRPMAFATAVGATNLSVQGANINNGTGDKDNYHKFRPWVEILPNTRVHSEISWTSARTLAGNPTIGVHLLGKRLKIAGR